MNFRHDNTGIYNHKTKSGRRKFIRYPQFNATPFNKPTSPCFSLTWQNTFLISDKNVREQLLEI